MGCFHGNFNNEAVAKRGGGGKNWAANFTSIKQTLSSSWLKSRMQLFEKEEEEEDKGKRKGERRKVAEEAAAVQLVSSIAV